MSVTFLKKKYDSFQAGSGKYYIDCRKRIINQQPTTETWLSIIDKLKPTNFRDENRVLLGVLEKHSRVVIKIGESMNLKKEYDYGELLESRGVQGFVKFICFFECNDNYKRHDGTSTTSLCNGPGTGMKYLVMNYFPHGSLRDHNWKESELPVLKSLLAQTVLAITHAYETCGIIHNDLNGGNILVTSTKEKTLYDIPTYGRKIVIMDLENAIRVRNIEDRNQFVYRDFLNLFNDIQYRTYIDL